MQSVGRTTTALNVNTKLFVRDKVFSQWRLLKQCQVLFFWAIRLISLMMKNFSVVWPFRMEKSLLSVRILFTVQLGWDDRVRVSVRVQISKKRHSHTRRCSWHSRDQTVWTRIYLWRPGGSLHGLKTLVIPMQICGYDSQVCEAMVTKNVLDIMYPAHSPRITRWNHDILDPDQMEMYAAAITSRGAPLQNCFGFLDGTVRPIALPGDNQRILYNGQKWVHALKLQSVVLPDGLIANMYGAVGKLWIL